MRSAGCHRVGNRRRMQDTGRTMRRRLVLAALAAVGVPLVVAQCPNGCNGHGTCGQGNVCTCETGYTFAPDCSMSECPGLVVMIRVCLRSLAVLVCWTILLVSTVNCPTGNAWADKASAANTAHSSQECSNQGTCTRSDGKCQCYPGFTGRACQRCKNGFLIPLLRR